MCFGVRDAIALAHKEAGTQPITILGELVHNDTVLAGLKDAGIQFHNDAGEVSTETVMITAHGASERKLDAVRARGLRVLEATCPLVHVAHNALRKLVRQGCHPVVIGKRDHAEVRGLTEDFEEFDVVLSAEDIVGMRARARFGVVAQTTQPIARVRELVRLLREQFPRAEVRFTDTVCQPTKQRQSAAEDLARQCDVVLVIGGAHSNNTRELVETTSRYCHRVHHVQTTADLREKWFHHEDTVGITAGTSTPDSVIDEIEKVLKVFSAIKEPAPVPSHEGNSPWTHQLFLPSEERVRVGTSKSSAV